MEAGVEAAGEEERWTASTNWIVSGGSLAEIVSFETSEEDAPALVSLPLLLRPPSEEHEFLPCEVTVHFSGKHELHRIYARSSSRVYEIYNAAEKQNNCTDYLCTVRCSVAATDETPASSVVSADCKSGNNATLEKHDKFSTADSNFSNEVGWVEVIPDYPSHDHKMNGTSREEDRNSNADFQVYYEANADISDLSPCMSVTLRFLSLQNKYCVHISEIYIYADPVETSSQDNSVAMGEKYGGSSLLAMFMPSLLQLSKSAASRPEKKLLDTSGAYNYQDGEQKEAETPKPGMKFTLAGEESSDKADLLPGFGYGQSQLKPECGSSGWNQSICDQVSDSCLAARKLGQVDEQGQIETESMQLSSSQKITGEKASSTNVHEANKRLENVPMPYSEKQNDPDLDSKFSAQEKYVAADHIEKVLDELVSRVTRIEAFCSRFEESLLKPLNTIDVRLQKLESVLATVAAGDQLSRPGGCSKIASTRTSADGSDSKKDIMDYSSPSRDDNTVYDSSLPADITDCPSYAADVTTSVPESRTYHGFVMKAPEFISDDSPLPEDVTECPSISAGVRTSVSDSSGFVMKARELISDDSTLPDDVMECPSLAAGVTTSVSDSRTYQGFVMKAPEIISEDDDCLKNDSLTSEMSYSTSKKLSEIENEDDVCIRNDSRLESYVNFVKGKKVSSIDSALVSALEAFLTSKPRPHVMEPREISTGEESSMNSSVVGVVCNETDSYVETSDEVQEETSDSNSLLSAEAASKMCGRNYGKDRGCGISTIIALDDSPAPLDTFFSSLTCDRNDDKDSACGISSILGVSAPSDDSSKPLNTLISCLHSSLMDSGLRLKVPVFPNNEDERESCRDTFHKDQACMPMNGACAPSLVASPSFSGLNTSMCSSNLSDTSSASYNLAKSAASSVMVRIPCEVDGLLTEDHVNKAVGDCLREFSETSPDKIKQCSSMEDLAEESDDCPLDCSSASAVKTDERRLMDEGYCSLSLGLHHSSNMEPQICLVNDIDHNEDESFDPDLSQFGKRWSRSDLTDLHSEQTGIVNVSSDVVVTSHTANEVNITLLDNIYDGALGREVEQTPNSAICSDHLQVNFVPQEDLTPGVPLDHLREVNFVPQEYWTPGVPLETLPEEIYDVGDQDSATGATDELHAGDELLEGMLRFAFPAENYGLRNDVGESLLNVDIDAFG